MTDRISKDLRSKVMSSIRGRNTKPELMLRKLLWNAGLRYRVHAHLPGRPDIVFRGPQVAIFVDGCFWHGCPIHYKRPSSNEAFWDNKLKLNMARDDKVDLLLIADGWTVMRFWEHEILEHPGDCANEVTQHIASINEKN